MRKYSLTYSNDMYEFLLNNASSHTIKELAQIIKEKFNMDIEKKKLAQYCIKMKIKYKYEKPNKSHSNVPTKIGTIVNKTDGNYLKIKTMDHKWEYLQRKVYEKYHNIKLKEDEYVIFLNQNRRDFSKENLKVVSRKISAILSNDNLISNNKDIMNLSIITAQLKEKIKEVYNETN